MTTSAESPMRILHIVPHVSPTRLFGGPNTVAVTQASALLRAGNCVEIVAAGDGFGYGPQVIEGVPATVFRSRRTVGSSFASRYAPGISHWVARNQSRFDIAHVHVARDFVVLPSATRLRIPYVLQPHGMIRTPQTQLKRTYDRAFTRSVFSSASGVIGINAEETAELEAAFGVRNCVTVPNTIVPSPFRHSPAGDMIRVTFLARLHPRKRPELFARAAVEIARREPRFTFDIVGPDEGSLAEVRKVIAGAPPGRINYIPALDGDGVSRQLARSDVYVLPSTREPFGLTLLEAVSVGVPVIADRSAPLGNELARERLGEVFDGSLPGLVSAILRVSDDRDMRERVAAVGPETVEKRWGSGSTAAALHDFYRVAMRSAR